MGRREWVEPIIQLKAMYHGEGSTGLAPGSRQGRAARCKKVIHEKGEREVVSVDHTRTESHADRACQ